MRETKYDASVQIKRFQRERFWNNLKKKVWSKITYELRARQHQRIYKKLKLEPERLRFLVKINFGGLFFFGVVGGGTWKK